jgi:hypothetical protein
LLGGIHVVGSMAFAEAFWIHDTFIAAVTCTAGAAPEHVEIVALVVAIFKAVRADRHTGG